MSRIFSKELRKLAAKKKSSSSSDSTSDSGEGVNIEERRPRTTEQVYSNRCNLENCRVLTSVSSPAAFFAQFFVFFFPFRMQEN